MKLDLARLYHDGHKPWQPQGIARWPQQWKRDKLTACYGILLRNGQIHGEFMVISAISANGHISARDHPIHFMFGSVVGFTRSADRMVLFLVWPHWIGMWEKTLSSENMSEAIMVVAIMVIVCGRHCRTRPGHSYQMSHNWSVVTCLWLLGTVPWHLCWMLFKLWCLNV